MRRGRFIRRDEARGGLLDNPVLFSLLMVLLGGVVVVCLVVGYFCVRLGGPRRFAAHVQRLPDVIEFDGVSFGDPRFWKGADGIQATDWVSPASGDVGERRLRLLWAERRERDTARELLAWDLEQYIENENHHEGGEALQSKVWSTTACKSGRLNGERFVSIVVCRDDCVPVCIELQEFLNRSRPPDPCTPESLRHPNRPKQPGSAREAAREVR